MAITKAPKATARQIDSFIAGGLDAPAPAAPAPAAAPVAARVPVQAAPSGGRKQQISLTIEPNVLAELDGVARGLGISRAAAFSLAVSRFVASEKRGPQ